MGGEEEGAYDDDDDDDDDGEEEEEARKKRASGLHYATTTTAIISLTLLVVCYLIFISPWSATRNALSHTLSLLFPVTANTARMNVFQIYRPPPTPPPPPTHSCSTILMSHTFAFSYGHPYVGIYTPPPPKHCPFDTVTMTLTVTSAGRQFDRLGLMFLGDVEVFRTSTAEPSPDGIEWTYEKDMTAYLALWRREQKVVFDLGNLVDERYTGAFETKVVVSFWERGERDDREKVQAADVILPISKQRAAFDEPSAFTLPGDDATVGWSLPGAGVARAIISISACGQATEEFWYSNVLSEDTDTFLNTTGRLYGFSPFREVQLLIDGYLAGVVWPFPIIFTGGIAPGFWRPIVGIDAFDLREPEIDITPWIPYLSDGEEHHFQIKVVGIEGQGDDLGLSQTVGDNWVVTGKILVFLKSRNSSAANRDGQALPSISAPDPVIDARSSITKSNITGTNETLSYSLNVSRSLTITSSAGSWIQTLEYANGNRLTSEGLTQWTDQYTKISSIALNFDQPRQSYSVTGVYPLSVNTSIVLEGDTGISIDASIFRGLTIESTGRQDTSLFTLASGPSELKTRQLGKAHYSSRPNGSYSFGDTTQDFWESSRQGVSIVHAKAVNGSIGSEDGDPYRSLRDTVGRGPGKPEKILP